MKPPSTVAEAAGSNPMRRYGLPVTEGAGIPHPDAEGITEEVIHDVVVEFYRRARRDECLGPVFEAHIHEWETHLARMIDFWSAALLRSGRYSGRPVERHRAIDRLSADHFSRWIELFESTVRDLCPAGQANAFMVRARLMRQGMSRVLGLVPDGAGSKNGSTGR
jgi:hemoglobin